MIRSLPSLDYGRDQITDVSGLRPCLDCGRDQIVRPRSDYGRDDLDYGCDDQIAAVILFRP